MKPWKMLYQFGTDTDCLVTHYHESEESALRDACLHIIDEGMAEMSQKDESHREIVQAFLDLVEQGEFALALQGYQKAIRENEWDELVEVSQDELLTSTDIPLMQSVADLREEWGTKVEDEG